MCRKNGIYCFAIALGFILVLGSVVLVVDLDDNDIESTEIISEPERIGFLGGTPHAPININGDDNFGNTALAEGWPGDGSAETPYIIESLDIDGGGAPGHDISISNTRVNFVIRDSNLTGIIDWTGGSDIYLYNVTNGKLVNNTCSSDTLFGIWLYYSDNNTLFNNTFTGSYAGIYLDFSDSNVVSDNTCTSNSEGIRFEDSDSNVVSNNTCTSNIDIGINLDISSDLNNIQWNVFVDSPANGYDLGTGNVFDYNYWSDYSGTDANGDGFGDIPYTFTSNSDPHPLVYLPSLSWIEPPTDQSVEFEHLFHYELNILYDGPLTWSISDTMRFRIDNQGVVESLWILPIGDYALRVNVTNIYGISITATFHVRVAVDADNPPGWLTTPTDQSLAFGEEFDYQVVAIDPSGIDRWELNDTTHFTLSASIYFDGSTARLSNKSILEVGSYGLNISVYDVYGNRLSAVFSITVTTTTTTITTPTTTGSTSTIPGGIDPVMTLALGAGLGGATVIVIVILLLRRKS